MTEPVIHHPFLYADVIPPGVDLVAEVRALNDAGVEIPWSWSLSRERINAFDRESVSLTFGVNNEVGMVEWSRGMGSHVPVGGTNTEWVSYFLAGAHESVVPPGAEVPVEVVYAAVAEFLTTWEVPTCVEWRVAPEREVRVRPDRPEPGGATRPVTEYRFLDGETMPPGVDLVAEVRALNDAGVEKPWMWTLSRVPIVPFDQESVKLDFGVDNEKGMLSLRRGIAPRVPVDGTNPDWVTYHQGGYDPVGVPPHAEVPVEVVYAAVAEFLTTWEVPTCVEWTDEPELRFPPVER